MPFEQVQQWIKSRGDKKSSQDPPSSPAYEAEPPVHTAEAPAHMDGPPAFMAGRRTATFFTPEGRMNYVIEHLRLDPATAATYEQAINDGSHMVGRHGYGELQEIDQFELDYWVTKERGKDPYRVKKGGNLVMVPEGYLIYLDEMSKARRRGEIEREILMLQEKAQQKFHKGLNGFIRSNCRIDIHILEKELVKIQAIGGRRTLNSW
ncbi:uncharacterized protein FTJAE_3582 [Fusarium tjaetaba]|uniref:Uncharacterized protein n=1 Tax=Fusarium tjaetaba TaxID=1567544 RepID=A0A8H5W1R5_9HYPO|nr:uncharacterized protein FTJAE_3582 [Fusarium tjaetaba]KAF5642425.1 hypothetical protein FTJAE_3582 [Fusarium tjaetaba]